MSTTADTEEGTGHRHGEKGVYYAGEWLDIEDCDGVFTNLPNCSDCPSAEPCPRSASRRPANVAAKMAKKGDGDVYDVLIVGAGCVGGTIARELSKYAVSVLWVEAADDVSQGATKGNSGIVHAGYDDKPGSVRAKYCWKGNQMFADLDRELRFGYQKNGSLVVAFNAAEKRVLQELMDRGAQNGVQRLRIVEQKELRQMEPAINPEAVAALYAPDAGNVIPYEFTIALAENAVDNGVELRIRRRLGEINAIKSPSEGGEEPLFECKMEYWEPGQYVQALEKSGWEAKLQISIISFGGMIFLHYAATKNGTLHAEVFSARYNLFVCIVLCC